MSPNISTPASVFEKVLAAYETGGITYSDVLAQLRRLLATDAPPADLLEILRRRELIEPLPESAHTQVVGLLNDALERAEAVQVESATPVVEPSPEPPPPVPATPVSSPGATPFPVPAVDTARIAGLATDLAVARAALAAEQRRAQDIEKAYAESMASNEAARARDEETLRKLERYQIEFRTLREAVAARETELRDARARAANVEAELAASRAALQSEQGRARSASKALAESAASSEVESRTLREAQARAAALESELALARSVLEAEQNRARTAAQALADSTASAAGARSKAEKALRELEHFQIELRSLRTAHAALQHEQAKALPSLAASAAENGKLQSELEAARAQIEAVTHELKASRDAAASMKLQFDQNEVQLGALRAELSAMKTQAGSYLEILRTREWRSGVDRATVGELDATPAAAGLHPASPASQALPPAASAVEFGLPRPATFATALRTWSRSVRDSAVDLALRARGGRWKPSETRRAMGLIVAIGGVALIVWYLFHLASVPQHASSGVASSASDPGTVIRDCPTCPSLTVLPTGRFKQGSARGDGGASASDKPLHWVLIGRPIAMSTSTVTVDQFRPFAAATGRDMQGCDSYDGEWQRVVNNSWSNPGFEQTGSHPVTCTSWNDAQAYAQWLSATTGHRYRLPSASEWEYAARSGTESSQPWSSDGTDACVNANVADKSAARRFPGWTTFACDDGFVNTAPVGSFKSNAFGLNDMLGNVFQWTEDCWHADYNGAPIDGSARTDGNCSEHELRGGSWFSSPAYVRANYRNHFGIDYRASSIGIRLVRELD